MSIEQTRNCGCGNNDNNILSEMQMNNNLDNGTNNKVDCELRREMMQEIRCLEFAITELALYLDTHSEDEKALCLHRKYCKKLKELKDKYQKVYGPLTINFPCNKWRWIEMPWPPFVSEVNNYLSI